MLRVKVFRAQFRRNNNKGGEPRRFLWICQLTAAVLFFYSSSVTKFFAVGAGPPSHPPSTRREVVPGDFLLQGSRFWGVELDSQTHGEGRLSCRKPKHDIQDMQGKRFITEDQTVAELRNAAALISTVWSSPFDNAIL